MKSLSIWGAEHPKKTVAIIIVLHILLQIIAVVLATLMYFNDWGSPQWLLITAAAIYIIGNLFYPIKNSKYTLFKHSYVKQKTFDTVLVASYILVLILGVNNFFTQGTPLSKPIELNAPTGRLIAYTPNAKVNTPKNKRAETRAQRKNIRKQIRAQVKTLKQQWKKRNFPPAVQALLVLLTLGLGAFLLLLIASLSCSLSCSGQGGLAVVVLVIGVAGVVILAIYAFRGIFGKKGARKPRVKSGL